MSNIYVTGSSGFLGRNLTSKLSNFKSIPHDKIGSTDFSQATHIYYLSTYGNMYHQKEFDKILHANIIDLINVLSKVDFKNLKSFVFISTSSVKLKVQTMYSRTKKVAEEMLLGYMEKYNAPITIIRPFSITGVGEQQEHLIPTIIRKIKSGEVLDLDPNPIHDFIDVSDVVDGILNLSENQARGIYELGSGNGYSNSQVLKIIEEGMGKKANVNIVHGLRAYDNDDWISTNFKSRSWGWYPKKSLRDSIKEMINA